MKMSLYRKGISRSTKDLTKLMENDEYDCFDESMLALIQCTNDKYDDQKNKQLLSDALMRVVEDIVIKHRLKER